MDNAENRKANSPDPTQRSLPDVFDEVIDTASQMAKSTFRSARKLTAAVKEMSEITRSNKPDNKQ